MQVQQLPEQMNKQDNQFQQFSVKVLQKYKQTQNWQAIISQLLQQKINSFIIKSIQEKVKQELEQTDKNYHTNQSYQVEDVYNDQSLNSLIDLIALFNKSSVNYQQQIAFLNQKILRQREQKQQSQAKYSQMKGICQQLQQQLQQNCKNSIQKYKQQIQSSNILSKKLVELSGLQQKLQDCKLIVGKLKKNNETLQFQNISLQKKSIKIQAENIQVFSYINSLLTEAKSDIQNSKIKVNQMTLAYFNLTQQYEEHKIKSQKFQQYFSHMSSSFKKLKQILESIKLLEDKSYTVNQSISKSPTQNETVDTQKDQVQGNQLNFDQIYRAIQILKQNYQYFVKQSNQNQKQLNIFKSERNLTQAKLEEQKQKNYQCHSQIQILKQQLIDSDIKTKENMIYIKNLQTQTQMLAERLQIYSKCQAKWVSAQKTCQTKNILSQTNAEQIQKTNVEMNDLSPIKIIDLEQSRAGCFYQMLIQQLTKNNEQLQFQTRILKQQKYILQLQVERMSQLIAKFQVQLQNSNQKLEQNIKQCHKLKEDKQKYKLKEDKQKYMINDKIFEFQVTDTLSIRDQRQDNNKQNSFISNNQLKNNSSFNNLDKKQKAYKDNILNLNQIINYMMNYLKGYTVQGIRNNSWILSQIQAQPEKKKKLTSKSNMKVKFENFQFIRKLCLKEASCKSLIINFQTIANFYVAHY